MKTSHTLIFNNNCLVEVFLLKDQSYLENLSSNAIKKKCWHNPYSLVPAWFNRPSLPPDLVFVCTPISSICSPLYRLWLTHIFVLFSPSLCSYHFHSLHVQGAVNAWDRGQTPLQEELRDSHHEWRQSCQSELHVAPGRGASNWGRWPHPDSGEGANRKINNLLQNYKTITLS